MNKFLLILSGFFLLAASACSNYQDAVPLTSWQIAEKQTPHGADVKTITAWRPVVLPHVTKPAKRGTSNISHIYLKSEFHRTAKADKLKGLSIEGISSFERVYLNNILLGSREPFEYNSMFITRNYPVPPKVLQQGKNQLIIDIGIFNQAHGGISGNVNLLPEKSFIKKRILTNLIFSQIPIGIILLNAGFILLLLLLFLFNRNESKLLFCALALVLYVIYFITLFSPYKILPFNVIFSIQLAISLFLPFLLIIIYQTFYGIYLSNFNRISTAVIFLLAVLLCGAALFSMDHIILRTIHLTAIASLGGMYIYTITQLNSFKKDPVLFGVMIIVSASATLMIFFEVISSLQRGVYSELLTVYISPIYIIAFSLLYSRHIMEKEVELQVMYQKIESFDNRERDNNAVITDTSEKKLQQVIAFLKENYRSDISREGLAHAIDMNPNYMSRIFKKYTNMKVNDYINRLRIEDAQKQLTDTDKKIIDIALLTGFESLATFNRVFKMISGTTPSQYRNRK